MVSCAVCGTEVIQEDIKYGKVCLLCVESSELTQKIITDHIKENTKLVPHLGIEPSAAGLEVPLENPTREAEGK